MGGLIDCLIRSGRLGRHCSGLEESSAGYLPLDGHPAPLKLGYMITVQMSTESFVQIAVEQILQGTKIHTHVMPFLHTNVKSVYILLTSLVHFQTINT